MIIDINAISQGENHISGLEHFVSGNMPCAFLSIYPGEDYVHYQEEDLDCYPE